MSESRINSQLQLLAETLEGQRWLRVLRFLPSTQETCIVFLAPGPSPAPAVVIWKVNQWMGALCLSFSHLHTYIFFFNDKSSWGLIQLPKTLQDNWGTKAHPAVSPWLPDAPDTGIQPLPRHVCCCEAGRSEHRRASAGSRKSINKRSQEVYER